MLTVAVAHTICLSLIFDIFTVVDTLKLTVLSIWTWFAKDSDVLQANKNKKGKSVMALTCYLSSLKNKKNIMLNNHSKSQQMEDFFTKMIELTALC